MQENKQLMLLSNRPEIMVYQNKNEKETYLAVSNTSRILIYTLTLLEF